MHDLQGFEYKRFIALGSLINNFFESGQFIRRLFKTRSLDISVHNSGYKVDEVWKGKYSPDLFYNKPPAGYLYTGTEHGNEKPTDGREVIFFFTNDNQPAWTKGTILVHSTTFVVTDGKLIYAETGDDGVRQEFSVSGFKKAILEAAEKE
jgi:hypothetical protein